MRILRDRWVTVVVTTLITTAGAVAYTLAQTPLYEASTRLFVSTMSGASATELYQGNRLSQDRVLSYTQLVMGETLAMRTIDRLNLDMTARSLTENVTAKSKPGTVLIEVSVLDASPVRARDIANAMSDEFVLMARGLETPSEGARPEARVVVEQRASIPEHPVVPEKYRNLALGIAFGVILGIGLALLRDLLDNSIDSEELLEEITGASAVGYIPFDKKLREFPAISFATDNSAAAEGFRKLRTNLQFLAVDNPPRVILVTSTSPAEGKTTVAINIALALAEAEHNVALLDGDLRRPRVAKYLDLVGSVGFSTVLSNRSPLTDVLQTTKFPRLTALAAGPVPPNPSELLGSLAAKKVLDALREQFDYVIIDSAPLLAVTDAAILAADADGALVVVRSGETRRDQLAHSIGVLNDVGAILLGAILNMTRARKNSAYYYGRSYGDQMPDRAALVPPAVSTDISNHERELPKHTPGSDIETNN